MKGYIFKNCNTNQTQYEHVAKVLLSDITNVATHYNNKEYHLSIISGGKIGPCWLKDCCIIPCKYTKARRCNIEEIYNARQKIIDISKNSLVSEVIKQIDRFVYEYCSNTYKCINKDKDMMYKEQYIKEYGKNNEIKHISKALDIYNNWNYERIYRLQTKKK